MCSLKVKVQLVPDLESEWIRQVEILNCQIPSCTFTRCPLVVQRVCRKPTTPSLLILSIDLPGIPWWNISMCRHPGHELSCLPALSDPCLSHRRGKRLRPPNVRKTRRPAVRTLQLVFTVKLGVSGISCCSVEKLESANTSFDFETGILLKTYAKVCFNKTDTWKCPLTPKGNQPWVWVSSST